MNAPILEHKIKMAGFYKLVLNEGTDREQATDWFPNLITNGGLDRIGNTASPAIFTWGCIGTGTTTPAYTDTSLAAYTASTSSLTIDSQSNGGASTYTAQASMHWVYTQGAVVGNMAEVGVGWASGGGSLWSRALILDGMGSPTTLTVTSLDQLTVYYQLTCAPVLTDITGSVTISSVSYSYTGRLAQAGSFMASMASYLQSSGGISSLPWGSAFTNASVVYPSTSTLGAITSTPSGGATGGAGVCAAGSYSAGTKYRDSTLTFSPSTANAAGGIGCMMIPFTTATAYYQYSFSPAIPKDNTKTLVLVIRLSWDRA